jgi:hypothetical protein
MKKIITVNFLLFLCISVSQAQSKFQVILDYRYMSGLSEYIEAYGNTGRKDEKMYGNALRLSYLYSLSPQLATGVGIGADRYENQGYNTLPIFAAVHYNPKISTPLYFFGNAGYSFKTKTITPGVLMDAGIGYKQMFKKHFGLNFQFGYNLKQFRRQAYSFDSKTENYTTLKWNQIRHSLTFGIGLIF